MTDDPHFNPVEDALKRSLWCILVPTDDPDDPDIIGPFNSGKEAEIFSQHYPDAVVRSMASPQFELLCREEDEEMEAWRRPHN